MKAMHLFDDDIVVNRRQMDASTRKAFGATFKTRRSSQLDAPSWLWSSVVELASTHEAAYLQHCRRYDALRIHESPMVGAVKRTKAYALPCAEGKVAAFDIEGSRILGAHPPGWIAPIDVPLSALLGAQSLQGMIGCQPVPTAM
jgi:hypothetical protein